MRLKFCIALLLCTTLWACDKEEIVEKLPEPAVNTQTISFKYYPRRVLAPVPDYELIVSQKDGRVVLDTLLASGTEHNLKVKSNDTKFDITTISYEPDRQTYYLRTYIQVNPDKWNIIEDLYLITSSRPNTMTTIRYTNIKNEYNYIFRTKESGIGTTHTTLSSFQTHFARVLPADLAYMFLPTMEKYTFTDITSDYVEVDFAAESLPTLKHSFSNKPEGTRSLQMSLYGHLEAGDYSKNMLLYWDTKHVGKTYAYDMQYPASRIAEFDTYVSYQDTEDDYHTYRHLGPTIPSDLGFKTRSNFKVGAADFDLFDISFRDQTPAMYTTYWESTDPNLKVQWQVHASPEEKIFKGRDFMGKIKPKYLAGKNMTAYKLTRVETNSSPGYDYQAYLDYLANPAKRLKVEMKQQSIMYRKF